MSRVINYTRVVCLFNYLSVWKEKRDRVGLVLQSVCDGEDEDEDDDDEES